MNDSRPTTSLASLLGFALLLGVNHASAEANAGQRAAAEALFQQGAQLMEQKHFNEACEKFAASQELDPGVGTTLYLADCYEQAGKTASAWALFQEGADGASRAQQPDREHIATERAAALEGRLSKLELRVPAGRRVPGLELRINDAPVPGASWNLPMPVDPGQAKIVARAPGKKPWSVVINVEVGPSNRVVEMAPLADAPRPTPVQSAAEVERVAEGRGGTQRAIGYVASVVGFVGLAAGGIFGYRAYSLNKQSKGACRAEDANACTPEGSSLREDAQAAGTVSTISTIGGAALVASGLTLVFTAPSASSGNAGVGPGAQAALPGFGILLRGAW